MITWIMVSEDDLCKGSPSSLARIPGPQDAAHVAIVLGKRHVDGPTRQDHQHDRSLGGRRHGGDQLLLLPREAQLDAIVVLPLLRLIQPHHHHHVIGQLRHLHGRANVGPRAVNGVTAPVVERPVGVAAQAL